MTEWQAIKTVPRDRYVLLHSVHRPRWDGDVEVGKWFGGDDDLACFWSPGGPNGGLEIGDFDDFDLWMELPSEPQP